MEKCSYCGKELSEKTLLQVSGNAFCDTHCRHAFEKNEGTPKEHAFGSKNETDKKASQSKKKATVISTIIAAVVAVVVSQITTGFIQKDFAGLKEFSAPDKSFTVMLPKDVLEEKRTISTQIGPIDFISYSAKAKHQEFTVAYSDYPDSFIVSADPQAILDGARDGALRNIQGTLLSEIIIEMNGHPGRELRIEGPQNVILKSRIYMAGPRLFQIMVVSKPDHSFDKKIMEVFDSFLIS